MKNDDYQEMIGNWKQIIAYGPRPFGSESLKQCSDYLAEEMRKLTSTAWQESYKAASWEAGNWRLEVVSPFPRLLDSYLFLGSGASEGFEGRIIFAGHNRIWNMYVWDRYAVVDAGNEILAYITVRGNGEAIPQMLFTGGSDIPHYIVGMEEAGFFKEAVCAVTVVKGYAACRKLPGARCYNVVGLIGQGPRKVVICAHYDTVYNTPGAYDNSSGAAVLLEIGRQLHNYHLNTQIELLLTDGEEFNLVGSRHRCQKCADEDIAMVLCIDGVGRDEVLEVWSGPEPFERKIRGILGKSKERFSPLYKCPPPPGSDQEPYYAAGIPACMLTFNDQGILHSPKDIFEEGKLKNMNVMVRISLDLLEQLNVINKQEKNDKGGQME